MNYFLRKFGLIVTQIVRVTEWQGKPYSRGIYLTEKSKEYNAKLLLPSQDKEVLRLKTVPNHGKFYINSYSRLCIIKPNKTKKTAQKP